LALILPKFTNPYSSRPFLLIIMVIKISFKATGRDFPVRTCWHSHLQTNFPRLLPGRGVAAGGVEGIPE
jgi:hypothetical protein